MKPPFLKKTTDGYVYAYTDALAKRSDMKPYYPPADTNQAGAEAAAPVTAEEPSIEEPEVVEIEEAAIPQQDYSSMHWKQLKKLMEEAGTPWTDKETAVKFLRGDE